MFGLLTNKTEKRLYRLYKQKMNEAYQVSKNNRKLADQKYAEADGIMRRIVELKRKSAEAATQK